MANPGDSNRVPTAVKIIGPVSKILMKAGLPQGRNALLTVRGRKSGVPRTTGLTVVEIDGRRWVIGMFGDVNWVRNLRTAGRATLSIGRRREEIRANEMTGEARTAFFRDVLGPYARRMPMAPLLFSLVHAREILDDPAAAAQNRPVFELHAARD
jgi:deazaflavin-dependent oxidoreductase (nitroreductase family)